MWKKIIDSEFMKKYGRIVLVSIVLIISLLVFGGVSSNICKTEIIINQTSEKEQDNSNSTQVKILDETNYNTVGQYGSFPYLKIDLGDNPEIFVNKMNGVGFDEGYGLQCVAGFKEFTYSLAGKIITAPLGAAKNYTFASAEIESLGFTSINSPDELQNGDWVIFDNGEHGHVAMYYNGQLFGQNQRASDKLAGSVFTLDDIWGILRGNFVKAFRPNIYIKINNDQLMNDYGSTGRG